MDKENSWVSSYWLNCIKEIIPKKKIQSGIQYAKKHKITEIQVNDNCFSAKIQTKNNTSTDTRIYLKKFTKKEINIINTLKYQKKYVFSIETIYSQKNSTKNYIN